jgi:hypothetical protein
MGEDLSIVSNPKMVIDKLDFRLSSLLIFRLMYLAVTNKSIVRVMDAVSLKTASATSF